jgi:hypothetical protein
MKMWWHPGARGVRCERCCNRRGSLLKRLNSQGSINTRFYLILCLLSPPPPPLPSLHPYLTMQGKNWVLCLYQILCHTPRVANNLPPLDIISASAGFFFPSVANPLRFDTNLDFRDPYLGSRIKVLLFSSVAFKMPTRIKFFFLSYFL